MGREKSRNVLGLVRSKVCDAWSGGKGGERELEGGKKSLEVGEV